MTRSKNRPYYRRDRVSTLTRKLLQSEAVIYLGAVSVVARVDGGVRNRVSTPHVCKGWKLDQTTAMRLV
jgi:hypothetical protein